MSTLAGGLVFKRPCARCPAVEEVPMTFADVKKGRDPSADDSRRVVIKVGKETVVDLAFLCDACQTIVSKSIQSIAKNLEKKAAVREKSEKPEKPEELEVSKEKP